MQLEKIATLGETTYYLRPDGIVYTESSNNAPLSVQAIQESFEFIKKMAIERQEALLLLNNFDGTQKLSKEARAYIKGADSEVYNDYVSGSALVARNPIARMIGNFILGLKQSEQEVKMFSSEETAVKWLLERPKKKVNSTN
ncbi:hypothetical protein PPO43_02365 [Saprospira sp. CCB-QB6]|uniref:DUF7793 family protein n=1 Tax=Saprospira sp. CCB-QB6 TaxID=3023936 RepID=UPI002349AB4E|nr:hypothetical protein [Saprospira sp. CCB-QB6]WCL81943.1 hypothetical protein PPO43_02365 [Saprospira sp. CCB-QB6]